MEDEIYLTLDIFLKKLSENTHVGNTGDFNPHSPVGIAVIKLAKQYDLVDFNGNPRSTYCYITQTGQSVIKSGGFKAFISEVNKQKIEKSDLELRKLTIDVKNAERIFNTYWWTFSISMLAFIISVILLVLKLEEPAIPIPAKSLQPAIHVNVKRSTHLKAKKL